MNTETQINQRLAELNPSYLRIENESYKHNVPKNSETHFNVVIVSEAFNNLSLIKRHQTIYGLLSELMKNPIHALALHTFTSKEWESQKIDNLSSPECLGGGKK
ncbi:BolA family protein [Thorsellia kenyensis]|uniref:BolA family protein n=1 Tax=Thorsellia kenyensis TaxID=1549888 RepID=A0ABV6C9Q0_9GAMM